MSQNLLTDKLKPVIEVMLADYLHSLNLFNWEDKSLPYPIAVHFGTSLPDFHFVVASDNMYEKILDQEPLELKDFQKVLRRFMLVAEAHHVLRAGFASVKESWKSQGDLRW